MRDATPSDPQPGASMPGQPPRGPDARVTFAQATVVWTRIALLSFGGPAGQIAVMHRILVDEKRWIGERRFLHALNYCMLLPGPEATQLITYVGWLMFGTPGGVVAGLIFIMPGFLSLLALSVVYVTWQQTLLLQGLFFGLNAAVVAIVLEAVIRIGRRALRNGMAVAIAAASFLAIFLLAVPFPLIVLGAATAGLIGGRLRPDLFDPAPPPPKAHGSPAAPGPIEPPTLIPDHDASPSATSHWRTFGTAGLWLLIWWAPVAGMALWLGPRHVLIDQAVFFSKAAVVTFGGAYAVLPYVAQQAVERMGWLDARQMLDGLGMAETTPGPLIMVLQFVGFLGAYHAASASGAAHPLLAGVAGAAVTVWTTFVPCFLWIFVGAPYIERLRSAKALTWALSSVTAAVVGVILNLAVWFALHTLFHEGESFSRFGLHVWTPDVASMDPLATLLTAGACVAIFRFKAGMISTLLGCSLLGLLGQWLLSAPGRG